jgi:hypothetical protein
MSTPTTPEEVWPEIAEKRKLYMKKAEIVRYNSNVSAHAEMAALPPLADETLASPHGFRSQPA